MWFGGGGGLRSDPPSFRRLDGCRPALTHMLLAQRRDGLRVKRLPSNWERLTTGRDGWPLCRQLSLTLSLLHDPRLFMSICNEYSHSDFINFFFHYFVINYIHFFLITGIFFIAYSHTILWVQLRGLKSEWSKPHFQHRLIKSRNTI